MRNKIRKIIKGFTLVELLIVIAIIGILTVAFLPTIRGGQAKARDAAKKALLGQIATSFEAMVVEGASLPADTTGSNANGCISDYTIPPGKDIAAALGRLPQKFSEMTGELCGGVNVFYKKFSGSSYMLAAAVEGKASANLDCTTECLESRLKDYTLAGGIANNLKRDSTELGTTTTKYVYVIAR